MQADGGYDVVPGSEIVVAREARRDNSSCYYVDGKKKKWEEVGQLLRKRGIDLDHNRFLILQVSVVCLNIDCYGGFLVVVVFLVVFIFCFCFFFFFCLPVMSKSAKLIFFFFYFYHFLGRGRADCDDEAQGTERARGWLAWILWGHYWVRDVFLLSDVFVDHVCFFVFFWGVVCFICFLSFFLFFFFFVSSTPHTTSLQIGQVQGRHWSHQQGAGPADGGLGREAQPCQGIHSFLYK